MKLVNFEEYLFRELSEDPKHAAEYLAVCLEEGQGEFLEGIRDVIDAHHQIKGFAATAGISRVAVYKSFTAKGNPRLETLRSVLDALGLELHVRPKGEVKKQQVAKKQGAAKTRAQG